MTIGNQLSSITYPGTGATGSFSFPFLIPTTASAVLQVTNATVTPSTVTTIAQGAFTLTGAGVPSGGVVIYPLSGSLLSSGFYLTISRVLPITQTVSIADQGTFAPLAIQSALDYQCMVSQQLQAEIANLQAVVDGTPVPVVTETIPWITSFGADPTGAQYSTQAFQAAAGISETIFVPDGTYRVSGSITTTGAAFVFSPQVSVSSWTSLNLNLGPFVDTGQGSNIYRFPDRVFVGAAASDAGTSTSTAGCTFLGTSTASGGMNSYWAERNGTVLGISAFGGGGGVFASRASDQYTYLGATVWASGQSVTTGSLRGYLQRVYRASTAGTTGASPPTGTGTTSDGTITWVFIENTYMTPIGMSTFALNDVLDGNAAWAAYFEVMRAAGAGTSFALEIDAKNFGSNVLTSPTNPLAVGATIGIWLAAGGDATLGAPANPSSAAISIGKNATTWNTGIVIASDGLTDNGGGFKTAMALAQKNVIQWYITDGNQGGAIYSDVSTAAAVTQFVFKDDQHWLLARGAFNLLVSNESGGTPANYVKTGAVAASSNPFITSAGSDTNSSFEVRGKGTGGGILSDASGNKRFIANTTGLAFFGATASSQATITGSRGGNGALANLLVELAAKGLILNGTTA